MTIEEFIKYVQANTPKNTRPEVNPMDVIDQGLLNPNQFNKPAADRLKGSAMGLLGLMPIGGMSGPMAGRQAMMKMMKNQKGGY
jgi:hypothetical protein